MRPLDHDGSLRQRQLAAGMLSSEDRLTTTGVMPAGMVVTAVLVPLPI